MLVLSRKRGESIVIPGCSVTVTVVAVEGKRCGWALLSPADVAIVRAELLRPEEAQRAGPG